MINTRWVSDRIVGAVGPISGVLFLSRGRKVKKFVETEKTRQLKRDVEQTLIDGFHLEYEYAICELEAGRNIEKLDITYRELNRLEDERERLTELLEDTMRASVIDVEEPA